MAVRIRLRGHRHASLGMAVAAIFAVFFVSASLLTIQPHSESRGAYSPVSLTDEIAVRAFESIGAYFIENRGQVADGIRYYSTGNPSVGFRDDGVMFVLRESGGRESEESWGGPTDHPASVDEPTAMRSFAYMLRFEGSNRPSPVGVDRLSFNSNFFIGNDSDKWRTDVPSYGGVVYHDLYDGIDLVYRQNANGVKYEFIVSPGADSRAIRMGFEGAEKLRLEDGDIVVQSSAGAVRDSHPYSYEVGGEEVECGFIALGPTTFGFECEKWDMSGKFIIDPLVYSTFLGGSGFDEGWSIAVDSAGSAYATGLTSSVDFPATPGSFDTSFNGGGRDRSVAKLSPDGSNLVYCTYLGGSLDEDFASITVDSMGDAYVTGSTQSADFPTTPGALDTTFNGVFDVYVAKLNNVGSGLVYSTFIGGGEVDAGRSIVIDASGNAYIAGDTNSTDFPVTPGAYSSSLKGLDGVFVAKLNSFGNALIFSTYLGGSFRDHALSIASDLAGHAYVTGHTGSVDFPVTPGAFDTSYNGGPIATPYDVFVTKLNASGTGLVYSTFLGGAGTDFGYSIKVNSVGDAYVAGGTSSANFPVTPGSHDIVLNGSLDAFIAKLNVTGDGLTYASYLGGGGYDLATSLVLDSADEAYVTGVTYSTDFPTTPDAADDSFNGLEDVFVAALNVTGNGLAYSSFLGGLNFEKTGSITMDSLDYAYVIGETTSADFPTSPGAFNTTYSGNGDMFVTKVHVPTPVGLPDLEVSPSDITLVPTGSVPAGSPVTIEAAVHNIGKANASQVAVRFYDGPPPSSPQIGVDQVIPAIQRLGGNDTASVVWMAGSLGSHDICVLADPDNAIVEESEFNNVACATIAVLSLPDLVPRDLNVTPSSPISEGTLSRINVTVSNGGDTPAGAFNVLLFDDGNGNRNPDAGEQIGINASSGIAGHSQSGFIFDWNATPAGTHSICAYVDSPPGTVTESNETNNVACIDILVQPGPTLRPDYVPISPLPPSPIRVGMSSQVSLSIQADNQGNGTATDNAIVAFHEQSSPPFSTFVLSPLVPATTSSRFIAMWTSPAIPGTYSVSVDVDCYNNVSEWDETNNVYTWTIEVVSGPVTSLVIGYPNYTSPAMTTYVKSITPLSLFVLDQSGIGIRNTTYTIDGGIQVNYTATGTFFLAGEGVHKIEWRSLDWAGNLEDVSSMNLTVDNTPPATTIHKSEEQATTATVFSLTATDSGCGVNVTRYRIDGGTWVVYSGGFTLAKGEHNITYYSNDTLNNTEAERWLVVTVEGTTTPPEAAVNYKPIVALMFAIILLVAGVWSSKKRPWKGGKDRMAMAKSFMITSLPFVFAEAATGIVSLATGQLSIPPVIEMGMLVDVAILVAGVVVGIMRAVGSNPGSSRKG